MKPMPGPLVITGREGPDLDGAACTIALAALYERLGVEATPVVSGRPDAEAQFVLDRLGIQTIANLDAKPNGVVLVDASDTIGLPAFVDPHAVTRVIDHRAHHQAHERFPNAVIEIELVGAAATLIFEQFVEAKVVPGESAAMLLLAAILSNTQHLRGSVTTGRDTAAAAHLQALFPLPPGFVEAQFQARRADIVADLGASISRETKTFEHPDGPFLVSQLECPGATGLVAECTPLLIALGRRSVVNLVDPVLATSVLVVPDDEFRAWVRAATGFTFEGPVAASSPALLRKQIVARIVGGGS